MTAPFSQTPRPPITWQPNRGLRLHHRLTEQQVADRLAYILHRRSEGAAVYTIGREVGLSRQRVHQIIRAAKEAAWPSR